MLYIKRLYSRISSALGLSFMSVNFLDFCKVHMLFQLATNLSSAFVGTFLFNDENGFFVVTLYYFLIYLSELLGLFIVVELSRRMPAVVLSRIGLFLFAASYALLMLLGEEARHVFFIPPVLAGLGNAAYWLPYHNSIKLYTSNANRQIGLSFIGLTGNLIILISPPVSGLAIRLLTKGNGYAAVFAITVVFFICSALVSLKLPRASVPGAKNRIVELIKKNWRDRAFIDYAFGETFRGIRDGVYLYYLNVLIFSLTGDELIIGLSIAGKCAIAMLVFFLIARKLNYRKRIMFMLFFALAELFVTAGLLLWQTAAAVILYSILDNGFQVIIQNSTQYTSYNLCDHLSKDCERRFETLAIRSQLVNLGRVIGLLIYILLRAYGQPQILTLIILTAVSLPFAFFYWDAERAMIKRRAGLNA